jgi:hypothetical protein
MAPPVGYPSSYPPPNIYYDRNGPTPGLPISVSSSDPSQPIQHSIGYPLPALYTSNELARPRMSLTLPPPQDYQDLADSGYAYPSQQGLLTSPYQTPDGNTIPTLSSNGSGSINMSEYFPPFPGPPSHSHTHPPGQQALPSPSWTSDSLRPPPQAPLESASGSGSGVKTSRKQFTACGGCRHRRIKCDLKEKQDAIKREAREEEERGIEPVRGSARRRKAICTNCEERGTNCVYVSEPVLLSLSFLVFSRWYPLRARIIFPNEMPQGRIRAAQSCEAAPTGKEDIRDRDAVWQDRRERCSRCEPKPCGRRVPQPKGQGKARSPAAAHQGVLRLALLPRVPGPA